VCCARYVLKKTRAVFSSGQVPPTEGNAVLSANFTFSQFSPVDCCTVPKYVNCNVLSSEETLTS